MKPSRVTLPFLGLIALVALPFVVELAAPGAMPVRARLWIGGLGKILLLGLAAGIAWRNTSSFERRTTTRTGWLLLSSGLFLFFLGQAGLVLNQLTQNKAIFFPSPSDILFLLSYPLFIAALAAFLRAYGESGFPIGTPRGRKSLAGILTVLCILATFTVLRPVLLSSIPDIEKLLNMAYTILDFALLIPTVLLLRITLRFPGGAVWRIWMAILGGFLFVLAGDVLFAYSTAMSLGRLDPVIDVAYILGYGCLALGMAYQRELLT